LGRPLPRSKQAAWGIKCDPRLATVAAVDCRGESPLQRPKGNSKRSAMEFTPLAIVAKSAAVARIAERARRSARHAIGSATVSATRSSAVNWSNRHAEFSCLVTLRAGCEIHGRNCSMTGRARCIRSLAPRKSNQRLVLWCFWMGEDHWPGTADQISGHGACRLSICAHDGSLQPGTDAEPAPSGTPLGESGVGCRSSSHRSRPCNTGATTTPRHCLFPLRTRFTVHHSPSPLSFSVLNGFSTPC
jgi:hypothetical protein